MEKWVANLFNEEVLKEAADRFSVSIKESKKLGDFENYVYQVTKDGNPYILRLTHSSHREKSQVEAELNWVNFLHSKGVNVSLVKHSNNQLLVEGISVGNSSFFACLFEKAPGRPVRAKEDLFGPTLFEKWGKTIGHMHKVTKEYKAKGSRRERWEEEELFNFQHYLSSENDQEIIDRGYEIINSIKGLEETKDSFGLIHSDIHPGNFFYHEGEIYVFDFDDSAYHYFISDIAIPLYYSIWWKFREEDLETRTRFGEEFLTNFLKGYLQENSIDEPWIKKIPLFMELRDLTLYSVFHEKWDIENLSEEEGRLLSQIRDRLVRKESIVELDYQRIINLLSLERHN
jgi:amicoumacin kinase